MPKYLWIGLCLLPAAVVSAYFAHSAVKYTRMISSIFMSLVYRPSSEFPPSSRAEKITILDSADHEVEALFLENRQSDGLIIFCHESGAGKESWEKYAYFLPERGYSLLSFDFKRPAAQESGENVLSQWPTEEDVERLLTVIRWSKKAIHPDLKVVLFGVSNGSDIAFAASFRDPSVTAVIADGLFSMKEIFRDYIRKWAPILVKPNLFGEKYPDWIVSLFSDLGFWYSQRRAGRRFIDVEKLLRSKHVPLLMIHGEEDDYVPSMHQKLLERISRRKNPTRHLVIASAGHNEAVAVARQVYEDQILEFLSRR